MKVNDLQLNGCCISKREASIVSFAAAGHGEKSHQFDNVNTEVQEGALSFLDERFQPQLFLGFSRSSSIQLRLAKW